ncbi:Fur family transcriptional regulator [Yersinia aleksiciae]|uniref:Fur family transcriptional regulator n=1 Tax=Yersinia aleksiciae TaxID=263819 RepID=A0ABN4HBN0_YERAE|nr:Fur family transcriptional regulator [Yersinia aleksiciae]
MKPLKQCQRLIRFLASSAEKAAKSVSKQQNKWNPAHN